MSKLQFLVVSQRAIPTSHYNLKDLTGHGRFDILCRCILSSCRELIPNKKDGSKIFCFFSTTSNELKSGWLTVDSIVDEEDEISIAYKLKLNWDACFTTGNLEELLNSLSSKKIILLVEDGTEFKPNLIDTSVEYLVILGAQNDLGENELNLFNPDLELSLGPTPMLASQAITYFRQLILLSQ